MASTWFGAAIVAALAGSPHCLGMCGALACAAGGRPAQQLSYHVGRIGTYAALGAISGAVGRTIPGPEWLSAAIAAVLLVGLSLALAGVLPEPRLGTSGLVAAGARLVRRTDLPSRLAFGAVNGLLPCGLVYATLALPVAAADPLEGAAIMAVFGLGTVPALAVASTGLRRVVLGSLAARRLLAVVVLVAGLGALSMRTGLIGTADAADAASDVPPCHR